MLYMTFGMQTILIVNLSVAFEKKVSDGYRTSITFESDACVFETLIFTAFISMVEGRWNLLWSCY